ncbi:MAG: hypothetical protein ABI082_10920 [Dokdonella sp.]
MLSPMILAALCALALLVVASLRRIPEGHVYTFRRMGGHVRVVGSGTHWVMPLVERVAHKISLAGAVVAVDGLTIEGRAHRVVVYFQVLDPERAEIVIGDVEERFRAAVRALCSASALPATADGRRQWLKRSLNEEWRERGLLIARVDLAALD